MGQMKPSAYRGENRGLAQEYGLVAPRIVTVYALDIRRASFAETSSVARYVCRHALLSPNFTSQELTFSQMF